jgi:hypothetical protein
MIEFLSWICLGAALGFRYGWKRKQQSTSSAVGAALGAVVSLAFSALHWVLAALGAAWVIWFGLAAFLVALFSGWAINALARLPVRLSRASALIGLAFSIYSLANGIHGIGAWQFSDLIGEAVKRRIPMSPGNMFAVVAIEFWPFAAIGMGAIGAWLYWQRFRYPNFVPPPA